MIAHILYTKNSPHDREAHDFAERLKRLQVNSQLVEADSAAGASLAELYDLMGRPAVVLTTDSGTMIERWQNVWPLATDISYLAHR